MTHSNIDHRIFPGRTDMAERMRAHDWTRSPLGDPRAWPQALRTIVGLMLGSRFPMFVAWGPELGFLYNDAYSAILGAKHPDALGRRFEDIWSEIWSDISPLIDRALAGEATFSEDLPLRMRRHGHDEQTWFTFSYSPVRGDDGRVDGMFCACTETTGRMLAERRQAFQTAMADRLRDIADPGEIMRTATAMLGERLQANRVLFGEIDDGRDSIVFRSNYTDGTIDEIDGAYRLSDFGPANAESARRGETLVMHDVTADSRDRDEASVAAILATGVQALIAVPLVKEGRLRACLFVNQSRPRRWTAPEVALAEDVAERTWNAVARARAEVALQESEQRFRSLFEHHADGVFARDVAGNFLSGNAALTKITGYALEDLGGFSPARLSPPEEAEKIQHHYRQAAAGEPQRYKSRIIRKDGVIVEVEAAYVPIVVDGAVVGVYGMLRDITPSVHYARRIEFLASHDTLTSLPNRTLLDDRLSHAIAQCGNRMLGILFLDLNRFKMVNDSLGHDRGDMLLQMTADRLQKTVREGDTVARLGGDEFVVVLENVDEIGTVAAVADLLLHAVAQPFNLDGHELTISTSIGGSVYPKDGTDAATLLKHADIAMYQAKELGAGTFRFFDPQMNARMLERLLTETGLRRALLRHEFVVHYQPRVDAPSGRAIGVEALVRWMHPDRGLISPAEFVPLAEEIGLIGEIGEWVLQTACRQAKAWQDAGLHPLRMSVNLSAFQLGTPAFAERLHAVLQETGLDPSCLELEITETSLMQNVEASIATLGRIRKTGVAISIDDFGTGYSSLSYLKRLPIDTLKIDKSFIRDVIEDPDDAIIVGATIAMAHNLGLHVVAEGVTSAEQMAFLVGRGCYAMQGYLFSRPLRAQEIARLLRQPAPFRRDGPAADPLRA
ncbi:MAG: EAL domain-containing protein [Burkholderiaceae bacterium]